MKQALTGVRSLIDEDARVGRKSKTSNFFGYKVEFIMTTDQRIITAVRTANGAYVDGTLIEELLNDTLMSGLTIKEFYGDKAYFRKSILEKIETLEAQSYVPVSSAAYRIDESEFSYNKDSDQWFCSQGNETVNRKYFKRKRKEAQSGIQEGYRYSFEKEACKNCPKHDFCAKKAARKILYVGINTLEFYEISQSQKTDEFKEKYKKRNSGFPKHKFWLTSQYRHCNIQKGIYKEAMMENLKELNEQVRYFLNRNWYVIPILLVTMMSFGFTLTHPTISVDDTAMDYYYRQNELLTQGRFFQVLIDKILGIYNFRPFVLDFFAILCLMAAAVLWCSLFRKLTDNQLKPSVYGFFGCFFVSYPLINEIFIYMGSDFETGLGHAMIPFILFMMFIRSRDSQKLKQPGTYLVPSILIALTLSLYESFAVVYLFGIFAVLIMRFLYSDDSRNTKDVLKRGLYYMIPLISGIVLRLLIDLCLKLTLHLGSSTNASKEIHWDQGFMNDLPKLFKGIVVSFLYNGLVYLPITFLLIAIGIILFFMVRDGLKHRSLTIAALYLGSIFSIFSLTIFQGVETPYRACSVFSVFVAFAFMLLLQFFEAGTFTNAIKKAVVVVMCIFIIWQINDINKWFYVDYLRYEEEVNVVNQVAAEIRANYDLNKPVVFLGDYKISDNINQYTSAEKTSLAGELYMNLTGIVPDGKYAYKFVQSNGDSFLDWAVGWNFSNNVSEAHKFFKDLGYDFKADDYDMREEALKLTLDKPAWPKKGSIFETDKFIVVNFGITEKFENQVKLN